MRLTAREIAQLAVCAGLALLVGCHLPLTGVRHGLASGGGALARHAMMPDVTVRQPTNDGIVLEVEKPVPFGTSKLPGEPLKLPAVTVGTTDTAGTAAYMPPSLVGKPYGGLSVAIKWPDLNDARYKAQVIPSAAESLRIRVVGSDGKNRLSAMFFREDSGGGSLTQRATFFMGVEPGMLVEVRAYENTKTALASKVVSPATNWPPFNPPGFPEYDLTGQRILAEGFSFNMQVSLLKITPISVELDSSQLVAGIGGTAAIGTGGDPFFNNYFSTARFAELWQPNNVWYDRANRRLFWTEFPVMSSATFADPKERDVVRQLSEAGLTGAADNNPSTQVLFQTVGGHVLVESDGTGNIAECSEVREINGLAWTNKIGSSPVLLISQNSTSASTSKVRQLTPIATDGIVSDVDILKAEPTTNRTMTSVAVTLNPVNPAQPAYDILAIDSVSKRVMINQAGLPPFPFVLGGGQASPSATGSLGAEEVQLADPRQLAVNNMNDFLVVNGNTVLRALSGRVQVKAGGGQGAADLDFNVDNVAHLVNLGTLVDVAYDPVANDVATGRVAFVADASRNLVWRLKLGTSLVSNATANAIQLTSQPKQLAVSPDGGRFYVLDSTDKITKVTLIGAASYSIQATTIPAFSRAAAIAVGKSGANDLLFISRPNNVISILDTGAGQASIFGVVDRNELAVGDCSTFNGTLNIGGQPVQGSIPRDAQVAKVNGPGNLTKPTKLATDPAGNLYIADTGNNRIRKVAINSNGAPTFLSSLVSWKQLDGGALAVNGPQGLDVDEFGNAFICDTNNQFLTVWRPCDGLYSLGGMLSIAGSGQKGFNFDNINANLVQLSDPKVIRVEQNPQGSPSRRRLFFIDQGSRIRMLTPFRPDVTAPNSQSRNPASACPASDPYFQYIISTIAGGGTEQADSNVNAANTKLDGPVDIALDRDGYVYVADGAKVRRIDPIIGSISTIYRAPGTLTSISIDDVKKELYFTLGGQTVIRKVFLGS
jgi:sugar lactone lactonase YvrE